MAKVPDFQDLPPVPGMPQGCAWGLWDKNGKKDVIGTLNLLTPEVIKAAYSELKDGISVSLNWPLNAIVTPGFGRKGLVHKVIDHRDTPMPVHGFDDEIEFNTQCSSQWDSLVHFHHQPSKSAYNGVQPNTATLTQEYGHEDHEMEIPTLNHWHKRGGLVARGVFIDFKAWADETGRKFDCYGGDVMTIKDIEAVAQKQGVDFRLGDVLIVRSGFTEGLTGLPTERQTELMHSPAGICGVEGSVDSAQWFWNRHFAAVAGDMIAFEHIPPFDPAKGEKLTLVLHEHFLGLFGMSIGELWDLKSLSETCKKLNRYTFLLTSSPLNYPGSVGSPPNALALF